MLQKKIEAQEKTIAYIKQKYKEKTGEQIFMPKTWEDYLELEEDDCPTQPLPKVQAKMLNKNSTSKNSLSPHQISIDPNSTFQEAMSQYQLPSRISYTKSPYTNFSALNPLHMIETISLSNFKDKGFSKISFRQLLNRIVEMRCLKAVSLSKNGIDDNFVEQIDTLFSGIKRVTRIDLRANLLGKQCLKVINKNFNHLQWLDISRNRFRGESMALQSLVNAIRTNTKLFHICVDMPEERLARQLVSYLKIKTNIVSFSLIDTVYDIEMANSLSSVLETNPNKKQSLVGGNSSLTQQPHLNALNFQFCYLEGQVFNMILLKSVSNNTSLIQLNLSSNKLQTIKACQLCQMVLMDHLSLISINLSNNQLEDKFAWVLAEKVLKRNEILNEVDISRNYITDEGAKSLYGVLSEVNDTLDSLGVVQTNQRISVEYVQKLAKVLRVNKISKEIRQQIHDMEGDEQGLGNLTAAQIASKQTDAFLEAEYQEYELLEPISITNPIRDDPFKLTVWEFD